MKCHPSDHEIEPGSLQPGQQEVAAVVLASGLSRRFGDKNKLLIDFNGLPIVTRTVGAYLAAGLSTYVVIGHDAEQITAVLPQRAIPVPNPDFAQGQSKALRRGVEAVRGSYTAAVIGVADQPLLSSLVVSAIVERYRLDAPLVIAPRYHGQRGNPVLFSHRLFDELLAIEGDEGGRSIVSRHAAEVVWLDFTEDTVGRDIDTVDDLRSLRAADRRESGSDGESC